MSKIKGMKTVDLKIEAVGHGCVNWNGKTTVQGDDGMEIKNHMIPKLRGFSNKTGRVKEDSLYEYKIKANDIDLEKTPMYISQNSIRHHLFREEFPYHLGKTDDEFAKTFLKNPAGLLKGYAITASTPIMKKSPLLIEDFVDELAKANLEVMTTSGSRETDTGGLFSKTTVGDTKYTGYGSINVEDLQFIALDGIFGRNAVGVSFTEDDAHELVKDMIEMLNEIKENPKQNPEVSYNSCWVRKGSCVPVGEAGVLLNSDAVLILVDYMIEKIENLYIQQAKGWMRVESVLVDYNDGKPMRIKEDISVINEDVIDVANYYTEGSDYNREESDKLKGNNKTASTKRKLKKKKAE